MGSRILEVGDKVKIINPEDWSVDPTFVEEMVEWVGRTVTIREILQKDYGIMYHIEEDEDMFDWICDFFEESEPYYIKKLVNYGK